MKYQIMNFKAHNGDAGTLRATADIVLERSITICDAKLVQSKDQDGLFMALPTRKTEDKYLPIVLIVDKALRKQIEQSFLALYQQQEKKQV
jgi:DNA-binding cell septation regulator SpoVG